jgi:hypothetical protein
MSWQGKPRTFKGFNHQLVPIKGAPHVGILFIGAHFCSKPVTANLVIIENMFFLPLLLTHNSPAIYWHYKYSNSPLLLHSNDLIGNLLYLLDLDAKQQVLAG